MTCVPFHSTEALLASSRHKFAWENALTPLSVVVERAGRRRIVQYKHPNGWLRPATKEMLDWLADHPFTVVKEEQYGGRHPVRFKSAGDDVYFKLRFA